MRTVFQIVVAGPLHSNCECFPFEAPPDTLRQVDGGALVLSSWFLHP